MMNTRKAHPTHPPKRGLCKVPGCGRSLYTRGLCQTHHRQMRNQGRVEVIRPYRKRTRGTVKFAGFRLSRDCARKIHRKAERDGISRGAAIAEILEEWVRRPRPKRKATKDSSTAPRTAGEPPVR